MKQKIIIVLILSFCSYAFAQVEVSVGLDRIFQEPYTEQLKHKNIALVTNQSAINKANQQAFDLFIKNQDLYGYKLVAAFAPEHGLDGKLHASEHVSDQNKHSVPIFSLHGDHKRPTDEMLKGVDLIVFDMQNVGVRCYTYETTLCYVLEEAAKRKIPVMVLDRPNPRGGVLIEGLGVEDKYRCFLSYNNIPFCHGMTMGELARYVNEESHLKCQLQVVVMTGWKREMAFAETGLPWSAPSPNIPDAETALVYPATILLGETLEIVSVDLRGSKPFKRFGAPWMQNQELADILNQRGLPGVFFVAETFTPIWGKYQNEVCPGILLKVTSIKTFQPLATQYAIFEELMRIYPDDFERELNIAMSKGRKKTCNYITGNENLMTSLKTKKDFMKELKIIEDLGIKDFLYKREKHLLY